MPRPFFLLAGVSVGLVGLALPAPAIAGCFSGPSVCNGQILPSHSYRAPVIRSTVRPAFHSTRTVRHGHGGSVFGTTYRQPVFRQSAFQASILSTGFSREIAPCPSNTSPQPDGTCLVRGGFGTFGRSGLFAPTRTSLSRSYGSLPPLHGGYASSFRQSFPTRAVTVNAGYLPCPAGTTPQPDNSCLSNPGFVGHNYGGFAMGGFPTHSFGTTHIAQPSTIGVSTAFGTPVSPYGQSYPISVAPAPSFNLTPPTIHAPAQRGHSGGAAQTIVIHNY
ncbi:MAG: hypothetical protein WBG08_08765 [Litorimonas sp.]